MKKYLSILTLCSFLLGAFSCKEVKKPAAATQHEEWVRSLNDSVACYQHQLDSTSQTIDHLKKEIADVIPLFEYVANSREVEGYYIMKGWKNQYPLTSTNLVARISKSEGFELIAALDGGVFNQISVSSGGESVRSALVAHDQALNYRAGNLNTVLFTGPQADSVAEFIAANSNSPVSVTFLGGAKPATLSLSQSSRMMIEATWRLYNAQHKMHQLEKTLPLLSKKIDLCRRVMIANDTIE